MLEEKRILDYIDSPKDLKKLDNEELQILADEIREEIVTTTSKTGGHVGSSLGTVETILAVHSLIDSPKDKFVFDVGHQAYAHKLVTGRRKNFSTLRKYGGVSPFTKPDESPHDAHYSGHASDSLSVALGLAKARELNGTDEKVVALIGDASIAGGMSFEALNQIGQEKIPIVIILNENRMSISNNVGGFVNHLNNLRVSETYTSFRDGVFSTLQRFGDVGKFAIKWGGASKNSLKHFFLPHAVMFEDLGITCTPVIDGHDMSALRTAIKKALKTKGPVLVHIITQKGAGYRPAIKDPEKFHGIGAYDIRSGECVGSKQYTFTDAFSDAICYEAEQDERVLGLTAAMSKGTGLGTFQEEFPERFVDVGIAEQHLVGLAGGLASGGMKPVVAIYSAFLQRAVDQMVTNVALPDLDVVFCVDRAGIVGQDGVTHHGQFDIVFSKMIPNVTVLTPSSAYELKCALHTALAKGGPFVIRYPRGKACEIDKSGNVSTDYIQDKPKELEVGAANVLRKGKDICIMAFGDCVEDALKASVVLENKGISTSVVDMRYVKPLDTDVIKKAAKNTKVILTVEDGVISGGAGEGVLHELTQAGCMNNNSIKFKALGIDERFICHGDVSTLKADAKIDADAIIKTAESLV